MITASTHTDFKVVKISVPSLKKPQLQKIIFNQGRKQHQLKKTLRFFKNKNIVESNKENIEFNHPSFAQKPEIESSSRAAARQSINNCRISLKTQRSTMRTSQRSSIIDAQERRTMFSPKIKQDIVRRQNNYRKTHNLKHTSIETKINNFCYEDKLGLQKLLNKNQISGARCLIGMNIPKIQETYDFSRFQLFNLYTYYKTLLESSNRSVRQLMKGFESIMYMNRIELNSQMIEKMFSAFFEEISFENFIKVYGNIQNLLFTQNIIEFMMSVFTEFYKEQYISGKKVLQTLKQKIDESEAIQIRKQLYEYYGRKELQEQIQVRQILNACSQNLAICKRIFNGMNKQPANKDNKEKK